MDIQVNGHILVRCRFDVKCGDYVMFALGNSNIYKLGLVTSLEKRPYSAEGHVVSKINTENIKEYEQYLAMLKKRREILRALESSLHASTPTVELCRLVAKDNPDISGLLKELDALGIEDNEM